MCHKENKDTGNREKNRSNAASDVLDKACRNMCKQGLPELQYVTKGCRNSCKKQHKGCCRIRGTKAAAEYIQKMEQGLLWNTCKNRNKGYHIREVTSQYSR